MAHGSWLMAHGSAYPFPSLAKGLLGCPQLGRMSPKSETEKAKYKQLIENTDQSSRSIWERLMNNRGGEVPPPTCRSNCPVQKSILGSLAKIRGLMVGRKIKVLEGEIGQMKSEISDLQTQVSDLKRDISVIHDKIDSKFSIMEEMLKKARTAREVEKILSQSDEREDQEVEILEGIEKMPPLGPIPREESGRGYGERREEVGKEQRGADLERRWEGFEREVGNYDQREAEFERGGVCYDPRGAEFERRIARLKSVYERKLIVIVLAIKKWQPYLLGQHFIARTDQRSLKYLKADEDPQMESKESKRFKPIAGVAGTYSYQFNLLLRISGKEGTMEEDGSRLRPEHRHRANRPSRNASPPARDF
ncbi:hypothetical protein M5K25_020342 [Dendrobium thyrsiflorum]|uniref:Reverse transcriptase RNase H-like domain-containing protein n=1 Tax=Dendrobium thyrsiflorum TaxID=117978 RepID=A0ABD0U9L6_DENTH